MVCWIIVLLGTCVNAMDVMQQNIIEWSQTHNKGLIKELCSPWVGNYTDISSYIKNVWLAWDNWLYQIALGFGKEIKMGYYLQDNCHWMWLCFCTAQGQIKTNPLPYYYQEN